MLDAVGVGVGFTVTLVVAVAVHPFTVTVTVYTPPIAVVAPGLVGEARVEVNAPGPLQLYVPPPVAVRAIVAPGQYGPALDAVGVGAGFTVTLVVAVAVHPFTVTVTVYTPPIAVVAPGRVGEARVEVNAPGPLQLYVPPPVAVSEIV